MTENARVLALIACLLAGFAIGRYGKETARENREERQRQAAQEDNCLRLVGALAPLPAVPAPPAAPEGNGQGGEAVAVVPTVSPTVPALVATPVRPVPETTPTPTEETIAVRPASPTPVLPNVDLGPIEGTDSYLVRLLLERADELSRQLRYEEAAAKYRDASTRQGTDEQGEQAREGIARSAVLAELARDLPAAQVIEEGGPPHVVLHLKSNRTVEGEVAEETTASIILTGRSGTTGSWRVTYPRSMINRVEVIDEEARLARARQEYEGRLAEVEGQTDGLGFLNLARFCSEQGLDEHVHPLLLRSYEADQDIAHSAARHDEEEDFYVAMFYYFNRDYRRALAELERFQQIHPDHQQGEQVRELIETCRRALDAGTAMVDDPPPVPAGNQGDPDANRPARPNRPGQDHPDLMGALWQDPVRDPDGNLVMPTNPPQRPENPPPWSVTGDENPGQEDTRPPSNNQPRPPANQHQGDPFVGSHHDGASDSDACREGDRLWNEARQALAQAPPGHPDFQRQQRVAVPLLERAKAAYQRALAEDGNNGALRNRLQEVQRQLFWAKKSMGIRAR